MAETAGDFSGVRILPRAHLLFESASKWMAPGIIRIWLK